MLGLTEVRAMGTFPVLVMVRVIVAWWFESSTIGDGGQIILRVALSVHGVTVTVHVVTETGVFGTPQTVAVPDAVKVTETWVVPP